MQKEKNERKMAIDIYRRRNINGVTTTRSQKNEKKIYQIVFLLSKFISANFIFYLLLWRLLNELAKFRELSKKSQKTYLVMKR
jgi:hypothetical protein